MAIQSQRRRRRRRSSQEVTRRLAQPAPIGQSEFRLHATEVLASLGVLVVAAALIGLIWINASRAIDAEHSARREQVEATAAGQATVLANEVRREMLGVDQSLRILKAAFQADPEHFNIQTWREQIPALTDVADDVFIADEHLVIQQDIIATAVGMGIGNRFYADFGQGQVQTAKTDTMLMGSTEQGTAHRYALTYLLIRLDHPGGWVVGASYRTDAVTQLFAEAPLGMQGMTALIDTHVAAIQTIAGPAAVAPGYEIGNTPMYAEMKTRPDGTWIGPSAPDNVQRIHAFHSVPGRDLAVVVAVSEAEAMQSADVWASNTRWLALGGTLVVLVLAAVALREVWTFRSNRRRRAAVDRERAIVANAQVELGDTRTRADARTAQLRAVLSGIAEGVLATDPELRVVEWNAQFPALYGIAPETLQVGLPIDEMLRGQIRAGVFGAVQNIEDDVARRMARLRTSAETGDIAFTTQDGRTVSLRAVTLADASLVLLVGEPGSLSVPAPLAAEPSHPVETL
jgi:PAS domain-containing protein